MGIWRRLKNSLGFGEGIRERAEEEARFHLDMKAEELERRGLSAEEARRRARLEYGNVLALQEKAGDMDVVAWLDALGRDLRVAWRRLRRSPMFLIGSVLLLAIGIGVNAAAFSVVNLIFFKAMPYERSERLVVVQETRKGSNSNSNPRRQRDWGERVKAFTAVGSYFGESTVLRESEGNRPVTTARTVGDWFGLTGVKALEGRVFLSEEVRGGPVALLTERGRGLARVKDKIRVGGSVYEVVGVVSNDAFYGEEIDVVMPAPAGLLDGPRRAGFLVSVARLRDGVTLEAARAEAKSVAAALVREHPETDRDLDVELIPAQRAWSEAARKPAWMLQALAALLLLITLVNLGGLFLARGMERERESAIRVFLGAGRAHLLRVHFAEAALLVGLASGLSLLVGNWGLRAADVVYGDEFPALRLAVLDGRVYAALAAVGLAATMGFALLMGWRNGQVSAMPGQAQFRARAVLIVAQAALGMLLLGAAVQMAAEFRKTQGAPLGFAAQGIVSAKVDLPWDVPMPELLRAIEAGKREMGALPGIAAVEITDRLPLEGGTQSGEVFVRGKDQKAGDNVGYRSVTPGYFGLMGIPLFEGELPRRENEVVVNREFAVKFLDGKAVGKAVSPDQKRWLTVVGEVGGVRVAGNEEKPRAEMYTLMGSSYWPKLSFVLKTSEPPGQLAAAIRRTWAGISDVATVRGVATVEERMDLALRQPRSQRDLVAAFALVALALVVTGMYAIMASDVLRRTREMGIRLAVGATPASLVWLSLKRALRMALVAIAVGLVVGVYAAGTWIETRPLLIGAGATLLAMVLAAMVPAWRGSRVPPLLALKHD
jgi:putative ABC transport system permease protein